ncbi:NADPH-dependent F420 reductase [Myroides pelagicus]|uniref:NADP oxidoreductase n=1 Tax=Myroides pelagicus TaxID=270914 RepID=A0A7K1GKB1_9FLAO|nr:NAD(P)-binding domain-containing protein [Myroides pelagicus]MEC4114275.1 NAD(P)-binding domain-containing protein [Myroides pelagicus]MTH29325.1 NADP oxidoreductase [Myroides pelagicus]
MKIGIIGAGNIGSTLAKHFKVLGHQVSIANSRGSESLWELTQSLGITAATVYDVARNNDVVLIAIPQIGVLNLPRDLFEGVSDEVIVIDTCNYYPLLRDGQIEAIDLGMTDSEWVSSIIDRPVVKAFNSITYLNLAQAGLPKGNDKRIALPVSGDVQHHKEVVSELIDTIGFDVVDNGTLSDSWKQEPGTPVYCTDLAKQDLLDRLSALGDNRTYEVKEQLMEKRIAQEKQLIAYFEEVEK